METGKMPMPRTIDDIDTPAVLIDVDRAAANIARAQAYADRHGLRLRPHIKTHKLPWFALKQVGAGASGITCQKIGEAEVMAQAGLPVPCDDGSRFACFERVFADIGDEQSIEQSLSTFSSHMRNIISILGKAEPGTLVLLDELGAGTDPAEGAALARAILETLLERGCTLVAIKLGAEGSMICAPGEAPRHIPAITVAESDPTGCGDAYCGGFLAAWVQGGDAVSAACHATVSASFVAETQGALGVLPFDEKASRERLAGLTTRVADKPLPDEPAPQLMTGGVRDAHG